MWCADGIVVLFGLIPIVVRGSDVSVALSIMRAKMRKTLFKGGREKKKQLIMIMLLCCLLPRNEVLLFCSLFVDKILVEATIYLFCVRGVRCFGMSIQNRW
jgi:hypothetical protein